MSLGRGRGLVEAGATAGPESGLAVGSGVMAGPESGLVAEEDGVMASGMVAEEDGVMAGPESGLLAEDGVVAGPESGRVVGVLLPAWPFQQLKGGSVKVAFRR